MSQIVTLKPARYLWVVGAIHGQADRLMALHDQIAENFGPDDYLVYTGNYLGKGDKIIETQDEMLRFRRGLMASFGDPGCRVTYLRGMQEEMWQKLQQINFAPDPEEVFDFILANGVDATLKAYGIDPLKAKQTVLDGNLNAAKWASELRNAIHRHDGHQQLLSTLRHAAISHEGHILIVSAGLDPHLPLRAQTDLFWWGCGDFTDTLPRYGKHKRLIRGLNPHQHQETPGNFVVTLQDPSNQVVAVAVNAEGALVHQLAC